jgi:hypothetical protein
MSVSLKSSDLDVCAFVWPFAGWGTKSSVVATGDGGLGSGLSDGHGDDLGSGLGGGLWIGLCDRND